MAQRIAQATTPRDVLAALYSQANGDPSTLAAYPAESRRHLAFYKKQASGSPPGTATIKRYDGGPCF